MTRHVVEEIKDDLLSRGYSRRQMMRVATMFGAASAFSGLNSEMAWAKRESLARSKDAPPLVSIGGNTWATGPMAAGLAAATANFPQCNAYGANNAQASLVRAISQTENVPEDHVSVWPGSTEGLVHTVVAFCSPTKGFVQASPGYDDMKFSIDYMQAPFKTVPLKADYSHDVRAMLAADPNAGVYYICTPNNPTATITPVADIEWLVENKPAGSVVLIDEAYIHSSGNYPNNTCAHLVSQGKDVLVARTFSKIFAMAGARLGFIMARPDLLKKLILYSNGGPDPVVSGPAMACGTASLMAHAEIAKRRKEMMENRAMAIEFLQKRNFKVLPSQANFFYFDWKTKTAKEMQAAFRAQGVSIAGPRWPVWPTYSRVSVGSKQDMEAFFNAFSKIVSA
jgi:histidinol-phosphate aminotransferase